MRRGNPTTRLIEHEPALKLSMVGPRLGSLVSSSFGPGHPQKRRYLPSSYLDAQPVGLGQAQAVPAVLLEGHVEPSVAAAYGQGLEQRWLVVLDRNQ